MAKDTEKLIRQLSLISFLMAERRPVSALEIKQDVEGYSEMNDDAFARRFYADRAELEALGINLKVEKPPEGYFEAELYTLPPENFYLPPIEFSDGELAALQTSLALLDGRFAYAEPLRLALQQLSWGRPSPLGSADQQRQGVAVAVTASAGGRELSQRLAKVETAISRRKTIEFEYYSIERDDQGKRKVDPYHLLYQGGQFYLVGHAHERDAMRVFRLSRITRQGLLRQQGRARLHDARRLRSLGLCASSRLAAGRARRDRPGVDLRAHRVARRARLRPARRLRARHPVRQPVARRLAARARARASCSRPSSRSRVSSSSWVLGLGEHARLLDPPSSSTRPRSASPRSSSATPSRSPTSSRSRLARRRTEEVPVERPPGRPGARRRSAPSASRASSRSPAS